jgi:hypothetical protein
MLHVATDIKTHLGVLDVERGVWEEGIVAHVAIMEMLKIMGSPRAQSIPISISPLALTD